MALLIGMDEAGLGPNLGPFVVAATVWDVPSQVSGFDFWAAFKSILTRSPSSCDPRLHVADSKQVFQPGRGIGALERGVWSALRLCDIQAVTFRDLCAALCGSAALSGPLATRLEGEKAGVRGADERTAPALDVGSEGSLNRLSQDASWRDESTSHPSSLLKNTWSTISSCSNPVDFGHVGNVPHVFQRAASPLPAKPGRGDKAETSRSARVERSLFDAEELVAARAGLSEPLHRDAADEPPWYNANSLALPVASSDESLVEPWRLACERVGARLIAIRADVVEPNRFNRLVRQYDNKAAATSHIAMNLLRGIWHPDGGVEALIVADKHGGRNRYKPLLSEAFDGANVITVEEGAERSTYRVGKGELRFQPRAEEHGPVALASMTAKYLRELAMHQFNAYWREHIPGIKPTQGYPLDAKRFRAEIAEIQRQLEITDDVLWRER